ncbi:hypothetical protein PG988_001962 [Apiospora saccharicola]
MYSPRMLLRLQSAGRSGGIAALLLPRLRKVAIKYQPGPASLASEKYSSKFTSSNPPRHSTTLIPPSPVRPSSIHRRIVPGSKYNGSSARPNTGTISANTPRRQNPNRAFTSTRMLNRRPLPLFGDPAGVHGVLGHADDEAVVVVAQARGVDLDRARFGLGALAALGGGHAGGVPAELEAQLFVVDDLRRRGSALPAFGARHGFDDRRMPRFLVFVRGGA